MTDQTTGGKPWEAPPRLEGGGTQAQFFEDFMRTLWSFTEPRTGENAERQHHKKMEDAEYLASQIMIAVSALELCGAASEMLWNLVQKTLNGDDPEGAPEVSTVLGVVGEALAALLPLCLEGLEDLGSPDEEV